MGLVVGASSAPPSNLMRRFCSWLATFRLKIAWQGVWFFGTLCVYDFVFGDEEPLFD